MQILVTHNNNPNIIKIGDLSKNINFNNNNDNQSDTNMESKNDIDYSNKISIDGSSKVATPPPPMAPNLSNVLNTLNTSNTSHFLNDNINNNDPKSLNNEHNKQDTLHPSTTISTTLKMDNSNKNTNNINNNNNSSKKTETDNNSNDTKEHISFLKNFYKNNYPEKKKLCINYINGNCKNGKECKYFHPTNCPIYKKDGHCKYGGRCKFVHIYNDNKKKGKKKKKKKTDNINNNNGIDTNTIDTNSIKELSTAKDSSETNNNNNTIQTKKKCKIKKHKNKNNKQKLQGKGLSLHNNNSNNKNNNNKSMKTLNNDSKIENNNNVLSDNTTSVDDINVKTIIDLDNNKWEFKHFMNKLDTDLKDYPNNKYQTLKHFCTFKGNKTMVLPTIIYCLVKSNDIIYWSKDLSWKDLKDLCELYETTDQSYKIIIPFLKYFGFINKSSINKRQVYYFDKKRVNKFIELINNHFDYDFSSDTEDHT